MCIVNRVYDFNAKESIFASNMYEARPRMSSCIGNWLILPRPGIFNSNIGNLLIKIYFRYFK